jgi:16S rRNA (adenine1518-N6/adenine1519-N6)-dimethyltransferase
MPKYSQVFLKDERMCERIALAIEPAEFDSAVEIGPGRGALTQFLYPLWGHRLSAVEIDPLMTAALKERFPALRVDNADFMSLDLEAGFAGRRAFIGNLPYECSTAILLKVLAFSRFGAAAFMFQREVARKITAAAGDSDYGYLSVAVQAQSEVSLLADVPARSFSPVPEVDSSVLTFRARRVFTSAQGRKNFLTFVKAAFMHRRKTLLNSLSAGLGVEKRVAETVIKAEGFEPRLRPQNLSVEDYFNLSAAFARACPARHSNPPSPNTSSQ